jgi:5-hydroxyisourate hydrolase-like protein (transthyretin family)
MRASHSAAVMLVTGGLLFSASDATAQTLLRIHVIDAQTGAGVRAARVAVQSDAALPTATTDSLGRVNVQVGKAGVYYLTVVAAAYLQQRLELNLDGAGPEDVEVKLAPDPIRLPSVTAEKTARNARLEQNGFYERTQHNRGYFLNEEDIEKRNQRRLSDLLSGVPGIRMTTAPGGGMAVFFQGNETLSRGGVSYCGPRVILNGVEMDRPDTTKPTPIDNIVPPSDLLAIEIYRRPSQLPPRFGGAMSACGVIVLWTK